MDAYTKNTSVNADNNIHKKKLKFILNVSESKDINKTVAESIYRTFTALDTKYMNAQTDENLQKLDSFINQSNQALNEREEISLETSSVGTVAKKRVLNALKEYVNIDLNKEVSELDIINMASKLFKTNSDSAAVDDEIKKMQSDNELSLEKMKKTLQS